MKKLAVLIALLAFCASASATLMEQANELSIKGEGVQTQNPNTEDFYASSAELRGDMENQTVCVDKADLEAMLNFIALAKGRGTDIGETQPVMDPGTSQAFENLTAIFAVRG